MLRLATSLSVNSDRCLDVDKETQLERFTILITGSCQIKQETLVQFNEGQTEVIIFSLCISGVDRSYFAHVYFCFILIISALLFAVYIPHNEALV